MGLFILLVIMNTSIKISRNVDHRDTTLRYGKKEEFFTNDFFLGGGVRERIYIKFQISVHIIGAIACRFYVN